MALNYGNYLKLDLILGAQQPRSPSDHDELLFIVIHQTYELWFKQLLHEGEHLLKLFAAGQDFEALATLERMLVILRTLVKQTDILETMTPLSFSSFRDKLEQSSGFQSWQFRQFEFFMGLKNKQRLAMFADEPQVHAKLLAALAEPSVYDSFLRFLAAKGGFSLPAAVCERDFSQVREASDPQVEACLLEIYRHHPHLRLLCEKLVDLDEGIQEWRYRHVKMVERTIGMKQGTGGSAGVDYLKQSLFRPAFLELWRVRSSF